MTDIVTPPPIDALPPPPLPTDTPAQFDAKAFATLSAQAALVGQVNAAAAATAQNAVATNERAVTASSAATTATQQADAALDYRNTASNAATQALDARNEAVPAAGAAVSAAQQAATDAQAVADALASIADGPVTSVNGKTGVVVLTHMDLQPAPGLGTGDLNAALSAGSYTFAAAANAPTGVSGGSLIVSVALDRITQIVTAPATGLMWVRAGTVTGGAPTFSLWRRVAMQNDVAVALAGGAMDCAKGDYFTETVSAARTFAFTNAPSGPYSCVLELMHTAGTITLPADAVWANGQAPEFATGKRHLIYFQRAMTGSGGWIMSALPGSAA